MATPESWENVTPNWGIRYPKPNAPAQKLPDAFQHMGTDLDDALTRGSLPSGPDTGWIVVDPATLQNGFTVPPGMQVRYRKIGAVVYLGGELWNATAPVQLTAFVLPSGFRPPSFTASGQLIKWGASTWNLSVCVSSNGNVQLNADIVKLSGTGFPLAGVQFPAN